ncbi:hypothetical protein [Brevundimonas sp.]|uniref:hypothetical protein n=1 Tax=Brevundimonas sp. TaxID=1871086 RepID=UPI0035653BEE
MTRLALIAATSIVLQCLLVQSVFAQAAMTVREYNAISAGAPRNPTALLRPSVRRAWSVTTSSIEAARAEETRARAAGLPPPFCIPGTTNISPDDFVARMRAVPAASQGQTVNQAVRAWMVERFPCR